MAAVLVNKFPGDGFLHYLLHLSMTWQMLDDSLINMPQLAHTQPVWERGGGGGLCDKCISEASNMNACVYEEGDMMWRGSRAQEWS